MNLENFRKCCYTSIYCKNFGSQYEYTVKVNLTHAGHTEAVGAGFGWEF